MRTTAALHLTLVALSALGGCGSTENARAQLRTVHAPEVQQILRSDRERHRAGLLRATELLAPGFVISDAAQREAQLRQALRYVRDPQHPPDRIATELTASPLTFFVAIDVSGTVIARDVPDAELDNFRGQDFAERFEVVATALEGGRHTVTRGLGEFRAETGPPSFSWLFAAPVFHDGARVGALALGIPMRNLAKRIRDQLFLDHGAAGTDLRLWVYGYKAEHLAASPRPPRPRGRGAAGGAGPEPRRLHRGGLRARAPVRFPRVAGPHDRRRRGLHPLSLGPLVSVGGIVLAAGLGTRLRPLTSERPKPAVPVGDRPMAAFSLAHLHRANASAVAMNAYHLSEVLEDTIKGWVAREGWDDEWVTVLRERQLLGTGGGVRALLRHLDPVGETWVMNGDVLFAPDLTRALRVHRSMKALATMVVRREPRRSAAGRAIGVELEPALADVGGRVTRVLGDPGTDLAARREPMMFTGVHVLSREVLDFLPEEGCIIQEGYARWVAEGRRVAAAVEDAPFRDLGTLEEYLEANLRLADAAGGPSGLVDGSARLTARVKRSVVGRGAEVLAPVRDAVVWPGARVTEPLERGIQTPARRVVVDPGR